MPTLCSARKHSWRRGNPGTVSWIEMAETDEQPLVTLADYEPCARARLPHMVYEYIAGGAGDEITLRANRDAFDGIRLRPRVLVDVSNIDTRISLFGREYTAP